MEVRKNVDGLQTLLGIGGTPATTGVAPGSTASTAVKSVNGDVATLSHLGAQIQQAGAEPDVRTEKVASVQAALAAGTYQVAPEKVAAKVVDAMLQGDGTGNS